MIYSDSLRKKVIVSWSTGKDIAYALHQIRQAADQYDVVGILSTITEEYDRVSIARYSS